MTWAAWGDSWGNSWGDSWGYGLAVLTPQWRVRHMGLGIGLTYIPRPVSAGA